MKNFKSLLILLLLVLLVILVFKCCGSDPGEKVSPYSEKYAKWLTDTQCSDSYCIEKETGMAYVCNELIISFKPNMQDTTKNRIRDEFGITLDNIKTCEPCAKPDMELWIFDPDELVDGNIQNVQEEASAKGEIQESEKNYLMTNTYEQFDTPPNKPTGKNIGVCDNVIRFIKKLDSLGIEGNSLSPNVNHKNLGGSQEISPNEVEEIINEYRKIRANESQLYCWNEHMVKYKGSPVSGNDVIIAIIDSGFDYTYPAETGYVSSLSNQLLRVSDGCSIASYDFVENDFLPNDRQGHGTHVTGIVLKYLGDKPYKILPIRTADETGRSTMWNNLCAVQAAINNNVDFINTSFGWVKTRSKLFNGLLLEAKKKGIVLVASAGNDYINNDLPNYANYPASYSDSLENVISVAALNMSTKDLVNGVSNYSASRVQVAANGLNIISIVPVSMGASLPIEKAKTGTSMAAPYACAVLADRLITERKTNAYKTALQVVQDGLLVTPNVNLQDSIESGGYYP